MYWIGVDWDGMDLILTSTYAFKHIGTAVFKNLRGSTPPRFLKTAVPICSNRYVEVRIYFYLGGDQNSPPHQGPYPRDPWGKRNPDASLGVRCSKCDLLINALAFLMRLHSEAVPSDEPCDVKDACEADFLNSGA